MDKNTYLIILYDYYSELLSAKEKEIFEEYYFSDNSLSEVSDIYNITRSGIHKSLLKIKNKLEDYEIKLNLYKKGLEINKLLNNLNDKKLKEKLEELL